MKSKIKKKDEPDSSKFKNLKSIKKTKKHGNAKKVLKNLKKELKASALDKENKFSRFVKQYNGASLDSACQQLLQFINEKNLLIPKRKKKFLNMVKSCVGEKVLLTEDQKISFFETIKSEYLSTDGKISAISKKTVTDQDGFTMFVGKKKKKNLQKQLENSDEQLMDTLDTVQESNQTQELGRKQKKQKNQLVTSDETFMDTATDDIQTQENNVTKTKKNKKFERNSQNATNNDNFAAIETVTGKKKKKDGKNKLSELSVNKDFAGEELLKIKQYVKEKAKAKEITKEQKGQIQKHMKKLKTKNVI